MTDISILAKIELAIRRSADRYPETVHPPTHIDRPETFYVEVPPERQLLLIIADEIALIAKEYEDAPTRTDDAQPQHPNQTHDDDNIGP
jgi:hypothetical protein